MPNSRCEKRRASSEHHQKTAEHQSRPIPDFRNRLFAKKGTEHHPVDDHETLNEVELEVGTRRGAAERADAPRTEHDTAEGESIANAQEVYYKTDDTFNWSKIANSNYNLTPTN